jgi:phosphomannomutase/phosphoglucomutase
MVVKGKGKVESGRIFGTNGIRFVIDKNLDPNFVLDSALAIGTYFRNKRLVLGMDTRTSGPLVKSILVSGLTSCGCEIVDLGVVPSPCIQLAAKDKQTPGVIITASHNPPEFNGIKCIDERGMELSRDEEEKIEELFWDRRFELAGWKDLRGISGLDYTREYISSVVSKVDSDAVRKAGLKVVIDCANGPASLTSPRIFEELGCEVVTLNGQPSGEPARPFEPTIDNLGELMLLVRSAGANLGIAHDGDADRTIFVDEKGDYVHGDRSLAIVAKHIVQEKKGIVVTPVSSSQCIEDVVTKAGGKVHYTRVGAPLVARTMAEKGAVFGGEENGGLIFPEHLYCRDGGMGAAKMLEIIAGRKKKLSALLREIPHYSQFKTKIPCLEKKMQQVTKKLANRLRKKGRKISTIDGIKLFEKNGWVLIRPSGTEPYIRIFSEGKTDKDARELAAQGKDLMESCIKSV